jgi:hypothetical protein
MKITSVSGMDGDSDALRTTPGRCQTGTAAPCGQRREVSDITGIAGLRLPIEELSSILHVPELEKNR